MGNFRDLEVWQEAKRLSVDIYRATPHLPYVERATLGDQMRRAAVSVASNIAEGAGRSTDKQCVQYLRIARGSLQELQTQLMIAGELGLLPPAVVEELSASADATGRLLAGLLRYRSSTRGKR